MLTLVIQLYVIHLIKLARNGKIDKQVAAMAQLKLREMPSIFLDSESDEWKAHNAYMYGLIETMTNQPEKLELPGIADMPPGSPIGCGGIH